MSNSFLLVIACVMFMVSAFAVSERKWNLFSFSLVAVIVDLLALIYRTLGGS